MARNPKRKGKGLQSLGWWFNSIPRLHPTLRQIEICICILLTVQAEEISNTHGARHRHLRRITEQGENKQHQKRRFLPACFFISGLPWQSLLLGPD
jgi:hypothetical protein